jgi:uncharacterized protein (TIGR02271 family)
VGRTVFALFDDVLAAQRVAAALERDGFDREEMSILAPDPRGRYTRDQRAPRSFSPLAIQGLGAVAVAGPLTGVLGGPGAARDLIDSLRRVGFAEPEARHYFESLRRGQALIAVRSEAERVDDAVEVMRRLGARAVDDTAFDGASVEAGEPVEERVVEAPALSAPAPAPPPVARDNIVEQVTVPVVEEQLEIGKRQVSRGGVRINSQIVEEPVEEKVLLREERLIVERRPVYRDATDADLEDFKEGTIEIHETVEEPVIVKRRRVVEEIVIGRETSERTQTVSETVRRTRVHVEPLETREADPAVRYAAALARDERFQGAEWADVEPHAQLGWERENAGNWDQFKDAVRGAWQKVSGR